MSLRVEAHTAVVEGTPGEIVDVVLTVVNDGEQPAVALATPIGFGDAAQLGLADQRFEIPARSRMLIDVRAAVPATHGIGQHAEAIEVRQPGASSGSLVRYTLSVASVERVTLTPTPAPVRGKKKATFDLAIVNNERHTVEFDLGATGDGAVSYETTHFRLGPGQRALTIGKVSHPVRWFGESVVHHVQLEARGRAQTAKAHLPFVQRPIVPGRLRSLVAGLVVVALWASIAGAGIWWYRNRGADEVADAPVSTLAPGDTTGLDVVGDGADDGGGGDASDSGSDTGAGDAGSGDAGGGDGGGGDAGGDAGSGDAGSGDSGGGDTGGDAGGGAGGDDPGSGGADGSDGGSGDGSSGDSPSDGGTGSTGADDSPTSDDGAASPADDTSVVRGTIDVDGGVADVVITPTPMSLQDVADADPAAFALAERSPAKKIWSARYVPPEPATAVASTRAVTAGPFAPDADGIWGVSLAVNQTYELSFRKPGFETESYVVTPTEGEQVELDVDLEPASASISGVANGSGGRLENVEILVTDGHVDYRTVTDENGTWGVEGVSSSPGYTVVGTLDDYGTDATVVAVGPGAEVGGVTLNLRSGRSVLAGSVVDASTGEPLGGATITAVNGADTSTTTSLTDGDVGSYQMPQLVAGARYSVTAELTGYRTATTSTVVGSGFTRIGPLRLEPLAATITGTVTDAETGEPISAASVTLTRDDVPEPIASVQTVNEGGNGAFTLGRVPPGQYLLTVEHWRHADVRHVLVVESATSVVLDPADPARSQTGPSFDLTMTPIDIGSIGERPTGALSLRIRDADESRECPTTDSGRPRPPEQCSAIFDVTVELITTDQYFIDQTEAGEGPFTKKSMTTTDPFTGETTTSDIYVLRCEPDGECNSGDDFPDYTIRDIPVGAYTVRLTHPDYNSRTVPITIRPGATAAETINLARLGSVIGKVIDATQLPNEISLVSILPPVQIRRVDIGATYVTSDFPDGTFQTDDDTLLQPGLYTVVTDGRSIGYWIDPDQDIDGDPSTTGLDFIIPVPDPDNPTGRTVLEPILAYPYPEIETRVAEPISEVPEFGPIGSDPTATLACPSEPPDPEAATPGETASVSVESTSEIVLLDKVDVASLDTDNDGDLAVCTLTVTAADFEQKTHTFGAADVTGRAIAPLELTVDRYVDVALLRPAPTGTVRQPAGTLIWNDAGGTAGSDDIPVPDATITPSNIITSLVPSDSIVEPTSADFGVTLLVPDIPATTSELDGGTPPTAVWDFGPGVQQMIGVARFDIEASGFPDATMLVTIDENGDQQIVISDASTGSNSDFDVTLVPTPGVLTGRVDAWTTDPDFVYDDDGADNDDIVVSTVLPGAGAPTALPLTDAGGYETTGSAGTWSTTVSVEPDSNLRVIDVTTDPLTPCLPPGVAAPVSPVVTGSSATFPQCVPPGGTSPSVTTSVLELGTMRIDLLRNSGAAIDPAGFAVSVTGGGITHTPADDGSGTLVATRLEVPVVDPDAVSVVPSTPHQLTIGLNPTFDVTKARVDVYRYTGDDVAGRTPVGSYSLDMTTTGLTVPVEPGAKYSIDVRLPSYGGVTGELITADSGTGEPAVCADGTTIAATVTAVPVEIDFGDPLSTLDDRWVRESPADRLEVSTTTCDAFTLVGQSGDYAIVVDHPEFTSSRATLPPSGLPTSAFAGGVVADPGAADPDDGVVTFAESGSTTTDPVPAVIDQAEVPILTIRQAQLGVTALDAVGGSEIGAYFTVTNGASVIGPLATTDPAPLLDPADGYTVEVRSCTARPTAADFASCVARFPVSVTVDAPRVEATTPQPAVEVVVPLLAVGGRIDVDLTFLNANDRPACPSGTFDLDRVFTDDLVGEVDDAETTLTTDADDRAEDVSVAVPADASSCIAAGGAFTGSFVELIPTGTHELTLPLVPGFAQPTLTPTAGTITVLSTAPADTTAGTITFEVSLGSLAAATVTADYEAVPRTVNVLVCGLAANGTDADCDEEFPNLAASLTEPGVADEPPGYVPATIAGAASALGDDGYPVQFLQIDPDAAPHALSITDTLHLDPPPQNVLVPPGVGALDVTPSLNFAGSTARIAVNTFGLSSSSGPAATLATTVELFGRNGNSGEFTSIATATGGCSVAGDSGAEPYSYCFDTSDTNVNNYRVEIKRDGYITETHDLGTIKKGATATFEFTLVKYAVLRVQAVALDQFGDPVATLPAGITDHVELVGETNGGAVVRQPSSTGCATSSGCVEYFAEPGGYTDPDPGSAAVAERTYVFRVAAGSGYHSDQTDPITAVVGGTPATPVTTLDFRAPRIIDVSLTNPDGVSVSSVQITVGGATYTRTSPFTFSSLDATNPLAQDAPADGTYLVTASDGRDVAGSFTNSTVTATVLGYLTVTGSTTLAADGTTVYARSAGAELTTTVTDNGYTLSGLDVGANGASREWTLSLGDPNTTTTTVTVTSTLASPYPVPTTLTLVRNITVGVNAPGVTIAGVDLTFGDDTFTDTAAPYEFSSTDADPIPLTGVGGVLVRASNGRNVATTTDALSSPITVLPYLTVTGSIAASVPTATTTVFATSGSTQLQATISGTGSNRTYTFSGANGLDVTDAGDPRVWTLTLDDPNTTSTTVTVTSSTASPFAVPVALSAPQPSSGA